MNADALSQLIAALPDGMVVTDPTITEGYRRDKALDPRAGRPLAVVRPLRTEDVQQVMRWATEHRVPVVTRGAGTGLSGGATAIDDGIVLCTERMREITVDPVTRTAVCQPGLLNAEVKKPLPRMACGTRRILRRSRSAASAATSPPMPADCAASSTASPPTTCWACRWCWPTAPRCGWVDRGSKTSPGCR